MPEAPPAPPTTLIFGAVAYDMLVQCDAPLNAQHLSQAGAHQTNLKIQQLQQQFGGCAANIAYGMSRHAAPAIVCAVVGADFAPTYAAHFDRCEMSQAGLIHTAGACARAFVFTYHNAPDQQFTAFYPGSQAPDSYAEHLRQQRQQHRPVCAVLAPMDPALSDLVRQHTSDVELRIWCPGQYTAEFSSRALNRLLSWSTLLIANTAEWQTLQRQLDPAVLAERTIVITNGARPQQLRLGSMAVDVPVPAVAQPRDPTGCGDAFIAGLLAQLLHQHPAELPTATQLAKLEPGQQNDRVRVLVDAMQAGGRQAAACLGQHGAQTYAEQ